MTTLTKEQKELQDLFKKVDVEDASELLTGHIYDLMPRIMDFKDQGELLKDGEDGFIAKKDFAETMEMIIPDEINFLPAHFLAEGAEVQKAVAMVTLKVPYRGLPMGSGWGTGFLISSTLFMTNNHVIPNKEFCKKVNMQFMYQDSFDSATAYVPEFFETDEKSFFYTNPLLDFTIVRLKRKPYRFVRKDVPFKLYNKYAVDGEESPYLDYADMEQMEELKYLREFIDEKKPISEFNPSSIFRIFGYTPGSKYGSIQLRPKVKYPEGLRLNIIQHPKGRKKEVVVQDNTLVDAHTNVIHYKSDTDYGSSGSPVFNNTWDLMALHHARHPAETANEGIRVDKIVANLKAEFQTANPAILNELRI